MFISDPWRLCHVVYLCIVFLLLLCTCIPHHYHLLCNYKLLRCRKWGLIFFIAHRTANDLKKNAAIIYSYKLRTNGSIVSTLSKCYSKTAQVTWNKPVQFRSEMSRYVVPFVIFSYHWVIQQLVCTSPNASGVTEQEYTTVDRKSVV